MLFDATVCILSCLPKIAGSIVIAFMHGWKSSPQAEEAGHPVADSIPPAIDLVLRIFAWQALWVVAEVSSKRISVNQGLFKGPSSCFNYLDWPALPASNPGLLFFLLHPLLEL